MIQFMYQNNINVISSVLSIFRVPQVLCDIKVMYFKYFILENSDSHEYVAAQQESIFWANFLYNAYVFVITKSRMFHNNAEILKLYIF